MFFKKSAVARFRLTANGLAGGQDELDLMSDHPDQAKKMIISGRELFKKHGIFRKMELSRRVAGGGASGGNP
jgi:hypothetical protein